MKELRYYEKLIKIIISFYSYKISTIYIYTVSNQTILLNKELLLKLL